MARLGRKRGRQRARARIEAPESAEPMTLASALQWAATYASAWAGGSYSAKLRVLHGQATDDWETMVSEDALASLAPFAQGEVGTVASAPRHPHVQSHRRTRAQRYRVVFRVAAASQDLIAAIPHGRIVPRSGGADLSLPLPTPGHGTPTYLARLDMFLNQQRPGAGRPSQAGATEYHHDVCAAQVVYLPRLWAGRQKHFCFFPASRGGPSGVCPHAGRDEPCQRNAAHATLKPGCFLVFPGCLKHSVSTHVDVACDRLAGGNAAARLARSHGMFCAVLGIQLFAVPFVGRHLRAVRYRAGADDDILSLSAQARDRWIDFFNGVLCLVVSRAELGAFEVCRPHAIYTRAHLTPFRSVCGQAVHMQAACQLEPFTTMWLQCTAASLAMRARQVHCAC